MQPIFTVMVRFLIIAVAFALLAACKPPPGGWGGHTNDAPYEAPGNHGGYTPS